MRRAALACALALMPVLASCKSEPDFDERYDAARKEIGDTAKRIDKDLEARRREAAQAAGAASASPSASPTGI